MFDSKKLYYRDNADYFKMYIGEELVWESERWNKLFRFEALEDGCAIAMTNYGTNKPVLQYSINKGEFVDWDFSEIDVEIGDIVYFKGTYLSNYEIRYSKFVLAGKFDIAGNIASLVNYVHGNKYGIFYGLFSGCTSIINAENAYIKLNTDAPSYMCAYMFAGCTNMKTPPEIPMTALLNSTYQEMFYNCTSLERSPIIPDVGGNPNYSFGYCFDGCKNMKKVVSYITAERSIGEFYYWMAGVSKTGDFYNLGGYNFSRGSGGIPTGWTVHTSLE